MRKKRPEFYALYKDFNNGEIKPYEVLHVVFDDMLNPSGSIKKRSFYIFDRNFNIIPVRTKEQLQEYIEDHLRSMFWSRCEWEMVGIDWPYRKTIEDSRPIKFDVWDQLEPNISVITDLVWDYVKNKIATLAKQDKK